MRIVESHNSRRSTYSLKQRWVLPSEFVHGFESVSGVHHACVSLRQRIWFPAIVYRTWTGLSFFSGNTRHRLLAFDIDDGSGSLPWLNPPVLTGGRHTWLSSFDFGLRFFTTTFLCGSVFLAEILYFVPVIEDLSGTRCLPVRQQALLPPIDHGAGNDPKIPRNLILCP